MYHDRIHIPIGFTPNQLVLHGVSTSANKVPKVIASLRNMEKSIKFFSVEFKFICCCLPTEKVSSNKRLYLLRWFYFTHLLYI